MRVPILYLTESGVTFVLGHPQLIRRGTLAGRRGARGVSRITGNVERGTQKRAPTRACARQAEATLLQRLQAQDVDAQRLAITPATMKALFESYVADLEARGKGTETSGRAAQTARVVEQVMPDLLNCPVHKVAGDDIFTFRRLRDRAGAKPSTINRDLRTIRAMLRQVRPDFNFPRGAFSSEDETRVRWLRPDEELQVLDGLPPPIREIAALTLMRLSELRMLRWGQVRLEQGIILLPRAKAGARPVVLSGAAQKILRTQLDRHDHPWVFPNPDRSPYSRVHISRVFRLAARAAGCAHVFRGPKRRGWPRSTV
jgi:integrase